MPFSGVEELLDGAGFDQVVGLERAVHVLRQFVVFWRVGVVPVVEGDVEAVEVRLAARGDVGHEFLRRLAGLFGRDHDGRAVGVVGADEMHFVALHALKTHPDIGLDVFHDVADVEMAVGIGQGGGDEKAARLAHEGLSDGEPSILGLRCPQPGCVFGPNRLATVDFSASRFALFLWRLPPMAVDSAALMTALQSVIDPNTGQDFVSTKALKNLSEQYGEVAFDVELGYPAKSQIEPLRAALVAAAKAVPGVDQVNANITFKVAAHAVQRGVQLLPG